MRQTSGGDRFAGRQPADTPSVVPLSAADTSPSSAQEYVKQRFPSPSSRKRMAEELDVEPRRIQVRSPPRSPPRYSLASPALPSPLHSPPPSPPAAAAAEPAAPPPPSPPPPFSRLRPHPRHHHAGLVPEPSAAREGRRDGGAVGAAEQPRALPHARRPRRLRRTQVRDDEHRLLGLAQRIGGVSRPPGHDGHDEKLR